jgi:hypothetical protein
MKHPKDLNTWFWGTGFAAFHARVKADEFRGFKKQARGNGSTRAAVPSDAGGSPPRVCLSSGSLPPRRSEHDLITPDVRE